MTTALARDRQTLVRRALLLRYATIGYDSLNTVAVHIARVLAGSV